MPGRVGRDGQLESCVGLGRRTTSSGRSAERVYKEVYVGRREERAKDLLKYKEDFIQLLITNTVFSLGLYFLGLSRVSVVFRILIIKLRCNSVCQFLHLI